MDATSLQFDAGLIRRLDRAGPRYSSYPTADRFVATFGADDYRACAERRNAGGVERGLALHVYLPFCRDAGSYRAGDRKATRDSASGIRYLDYLAREIELKGALFSGDPRVGEMHWSGGTPTCYDVVPLERLWSRLASCFQLAAEGDYSIAVDPRSVGTDSIAPLRAMGFNRVSFGVQDSDADAQRAVNPRQSEERTLEGIAAARQARFSSINVDLVYGLPRQTLASFNRTLTRVIAARPDRIVLCNHARPPQLFQPQEAIAAADVSAPDTGLELFALAIGLLGAAGYEYIGMDHFALSDDALAVAQRQGRLRRGFQGYTASADRDVVGLGASAISSMGASYSQNHRALGDYCLSLDRSELPVMRGMELGRDDLVRRAVIQELMCHFTLSKKAISIAYLVDFDGYFASELEALREFEVLGLVAFEPGWLNVTPRGRFLVRRICMVFDRYLGGARVK